MTENGTVYFRGIDADGNISKVTSYDVSNIDKVAPGKPTATANTTAPTNGNVTVTATFSGDSAQKQYSFDGTTWSTYTTGVVMTANGTVYFRGIDAAGNVSEVTTYEVSNITAAPEKSVAADLNGDGRADIVMTITQPGHGAEGATGAWLIQSDQTAAWGDLSTLNPGWEIFGMGVTTAGKSTNDVYIRNTDNIIGAWATGDSGEVTNWVTVGQFDADTQILGLGDFNGNGQTDLLLRNVNGAVGCFFTGGETTGWNYFQSLGDEWKICAVGDLNGDGRDDLVLKHDAGFAGSWLTQSNGTMAWADLDTLPDGFSIVGAGDFDGDGTDDVLLKTGNYYGAWLVGDGSAKAWFGLGDLGDVTVEQVSDFDGDGVDDLRVRTSAGDLGSLLVRGEGDLEWHYYGSVGTEWNTRLAAI
ncbi:MAG: FG-GAP repeat protein [Lentisphaeria bacterium]|nr:FG-GAP repeat protein [Lentisphaeria bacterium]